MSSGRLATYQWHEGVRARCGHVAYGVIRVFSAAEEFDVCVPCAHGALRAAFPAPGPVVISIEERGNATPVPVEQGTRVYVEDDDPICNCNPADNTGGVHLGTCPVFEPECTCYELTGGHQPGCYFNRTGRQ